MADTENILGSKLGRYSIVEKIGSGGMGDVYLATDTKLDRKVALKLLPRECCLNDERLSRFVLEARSVSALNHPNIITIYEIDERDDTHFIATEYVDGEMLLDRLEREAMPVSEVIDIAVQIASALATAHENGIVHRDIKPGNIMIRRDGIVKVLDFGIAKLTKPERDQIDTEAATQLHHETLEGRIVGTVGYMSPEQARGKVVDARTDIWSLGCVMYEMLTSRQAFRGETVADVLANVINREPASILAQRKDIPAELERIVLKALNKSADARYASASELAEDLKRLQTILLVEVEKTREMPIPYLTGGPAGSTKDSIVVLPFADISTDQDNRYFSEGLTEEIIMSLSKLKSLRVVTRSAAMRYVSEAKSHRQIAADFGVRYLLEGSVRRHGDELRITAQLIDAIEETYLWAETVRGTIGDVFEIQEEVAAEVVQALKVRMTPDEKAVLGKRYTENSEAYQLYLQGRFFWNKRSEEGIKTAIRFFEEAIEKDPDYALAWAGIADCYSLLGEFGNVARRKLFPMAKEAVEKALAADNDLAEAHTSLGILLMLHDLDWEGAENEFKLAQKLDPNYATAHHWYSQWLLSKGRTDEAIRAISRATELDPVSQAIVKDKGLAYYYGGRFDDAIDVGKRTLELDPQYGAAHRLLSLAYQAKGLYELAAAENEAWKELTGNDGETAVALAQIHAAAGNREAALDLIETVKREHSNAENVCRGLALAYASLGEIESAFEWLAVGLARREEAMLSLKVDPKADPLRADPRFAALLRELGLSD